ncbi:MAG TPA: thioredoxin domain-containing protein [Anaerolineales bacterium]
MSKRQEIRQRRQRERIRNRILVILLVVLGALLVTFALILPSIQNANQAASATPMPVVTIVPRVINAPVDGLHIGNPNALVKVDVYEDFRCSACLYYSQNIELQVITNYVETGKVYYSYHTFIVIDTNDGSDASRRAANAALCANEQGRFWDYHDTLFANQLSESATLFTDARLVTMAQNLSLDMTAFNTCYQAKKYDQDIQTDLARGVSLNLSGTPSILVNGQLTSMDKITAAIDTVLAGR